MKRSSRRAMRAALEPFDSFADDNMTQEDMLQYLCSLPVAALKVDNGNNMTLTMTRPLNGLEGSGLTLLCIEIEYRTADQTIFVLHW